MIRSASPGLSKIVGSVSINSVVSYKFIHPRWGPPNLVSIPALASHPRVLLLNAAGAGGALPGVILSLNGLRQHKHECARGKDPSSPSQRSMAEAGRYRSRPA